MRTRRPRPRHPRQGVGACLLLVLLAGCGEPAPVDLPAETVNTIGMRLILVPAGTFVMGSSPDEAGRLPNEGPAHAVRIRRPFYLGATEVTMGQFAVFVDATGYRSDAERELAGGFGIDFETASVRQDPTITWRAPGFPDFQPGRDHPVVLVSWQDAEAFCRWLGEKESRRYRLPTEAEWEYAARGGGTAAHAHGADGAGLQRVANVADASLRAAVPAATWTESWDDGFPFLAPVASFAPNAFGLHDMHGNAWEWCADWYEERWYERSPAEDPAGPPVGRFRAIRGGGWFNEAVRNRSAQRVYFDPRFRYCLLSGFRVVLEAPAGAP